MNRMCCFLVLPWFRRKAKGKKIKVRCLVSLLPDNNNKMAEQRVEKMLYNLSRFVWMVNIREFNYKLLNFNVQFICLGLQYSFYYGICESFPSLTTSKEMYILCLAFSINHEIHKKTDMHCKCRELGACSWSLMIWVCQTWLNRGVSRLRLTVGMSIKIADSFTLFLAFKKNHCVNILNAVSCLTKSVSNFWLI